MHLIHGTSLLSTPLPLWTCKTKNVASYNNLALDNHLKFFSTFQVKMATLLYLVPSVVLLALTQVQVTSSDLIQVEKNSRNSNGNGNCSCGLSNVTLTMIDNGLQLVDPSAVFASKPSMHNRHMHHLMVNVSRCLGGCGCAPSPTENLSYMSNNPTKSKFVCRPTLTSLKTVMIPVHWLS